MGVVIKQSGISSAITYLGAILGFVNTVVLFPAFLSQEELGLIRVIPNIAYMLMPLAQLGLGQATLKFYPEIRKSSEALRVFNSMVIIGIFMGCAIVSIAVIVFREPIIGYFDENAQLLTSYFYVIIVLILIYSFHTLVDIHCRIALKTVMINIVREVLIRVLMSALVGIYFLGLISFHQVALSLILIYSIALIVLTLYLHQIGGIVFRFKISRLDTTLTRKIRSFALYSIIGTSGGYVILNVDQIMISAMLNLKANAIYTTAFYFAVMIELSRRAISQITAPLVSKSFEEKNRGEIDKIYKSTAINQFIIGALVFIGITTNMDSVYELMPNGETYEAGRSVIFIIGLAKLLDMSFGANGEIISMSDHYRFNVVFMIALATLMILFNLQLIPMYGIDGAAYASLAALTIYNLAKLVFLWVKLRLQPFQKSSLVALAVAASVFLVIRTIPSLGHPFLDIAVRSSGTVVLYVGIMYMVKASTEFNAIVEKALKMTRILK